MILLEFGYFIGTARDNEDVSRLEDDVRRRVRYILISPHQRH